MRWVWSCDGIECCNFVFWVWYMLLKIILGLDVFCVLCFCWFVDVYEDLDFIRNFIEGWVVLYSVDEDVVILIVWMSLCLIRVVVVRNL